MKENILGCALPFDNLRGPNCAVTAVSIAAQISFKKAWDFFKIHHQHDGWEGRSNIYEIKNVLKLLNTRFAEIIVPWKKYSLENWTKWYAKKDTVYLVITSGHAQIVYNRTVTDQTGIFKIEDYVLRGRKIWNILEIERKDFRFDIPKEVPKFSVGQIVEVNFTFGKRKATILKRYKKYARVRLENENRIFDVGYNVINSDNKPKLNIGL